MRVQKSGASSSMRASGHKGTSRIRQRRYSSGSMWCNRAEAMIEKSAAVLLAWSSLPQNSHALRPVATDLIALSERELSSGSRRLRGRARERSSGCGRTRSQCVRNPADRRARDAARRPSRRSCMRFTEACSDAADGGPSWLSCRSKSIGRLRFQRGGRVG